MFVDGRVSLHGRVAIDEESRREKKSHLAGRLCVSSGMAV
jgi:hypothetical protein